MKPLFLLAFAWLCSSLFGSQNFLPRSIPGSITDSGIIHHKLDGSVDEWPVDKFTADDGTGILYAIDNNGSDLFLALNIPNPRTQIKMMRMGMSMYIDVKGKKKESHGIEFPVKNGNLDLRNQGFTGSRQSLQNADQSTTNQQRKQEMKAIRNLLAQNLVEIKIFGLSDKFPDGQQLMLPGSANIAYSWDSAEVMHIEYLIPLSMLDDISSLNQREISIGWKIHAIEMPKAGEGTEGSEGSESTSTEEQSSGRGGYGGGRGGGYGGGHRSGAHGGRGGDSNSDGDREKMMAEQKFWARYTINLQAEKKAF